MVWSYGAREGTGQAPLMMSGKLQGQPYAFKDSWKKRSFHSEEFGSGFEYSSIYVFVLKPPTAQNRDEYVFGGNSD